MTGPLMRRSGNAVKAGFTVFAMSSSRSVLTSRAVKTGCRVPSVIQVKDRVGRLGRDWTLAH